MNYKIALGIYVFIIVAMSALFVYKPYAEQISVNPSYSTPISAEIISEEDFEELIATEQQRADAVAVATQLVAADSIGEQNINAAKEANLKIAALGDSTSEKKLFEVQEILNPDTLLLKDFGVVRLIGVNSPNQKQTGVIQECFAHEAVLHAQNLFREHKVYLEFDERYRIDQHGRTLAYVYLDDGRLYNEEMISLGYMFTFKDYYHAKAGKFSSAENNAIIEDQGLWQRSTCNGKILKLYRWK